MASWQPARLQSYEQKEAWPCQGHVCSHTDFPREGASPYRPALALIIFIIPVTSQPGGPVIWEPGHHCPIIPVDRLGVASLTCILVMLCGQKFPLQIRARDSVWGSHSWGRGGSWALLIPCVLLISTPTLGPAILEIPVASKEMGRC